MNAKYLKAVFRYLVHQFYKSSYKVVIASGGLEEIISMLGRKYS